jgi:hypothetical protein
MAQHTPTITWREKQWRPRFNLSAKVLRDIESAWLRSSEPFPCRETVAVLLNIMAFDFSSAGLLTYRGVSSDDLWRRPVEAWFSAVGSPEAECSRLSPGREASECARIVETLSGKIALAAESWERAGRAEPSCEQVVQSLVGELVSARFAKLAVR